MPVKDGVASLILVAGAFRPTLGDLVSTLKVTGALTPGALPLIELGWVASAVYSPVDRLGLVGPEVKKPPVPVAIAVAWTVPSAFLPS